jgi:UDP-2,3-diacylglucosamine pyrophosphatase LpxH
VIIVLSDLHLMDGTAGAHHVEAGVFRSTFTDLAAHAREARAADIKIVFLGDLFDLIRSERWFEYGVDERPWGADPSEEAATAIMEAVAAENAETFELLSGSLADQFDFPVEPERVYVPGNHDRLCNLYPALRRRARELVGISPDEEPFEHFFLDPDHGVFARHGQEWDPFNFEGSEALRLHTFARVPRADYMKTPIGDVIAAELASKMPIYVLEYLPEEYPYRERIAERMRNLFDVRPLVGMVGWLFYQVHQYDRPVQNAINRAMRQAAHETAELPFVKKWIDEHDRMTAIDEADRLQVLLQILESFKMTRLERPLGKILASRLEGDQYALRAIEDLRRLDSEPDLRDQILYVLYGHTHNPCQFAIGSLGESPDERYRLYLNTGTWRPHHQQTVTGQDFISWRNITYTLLYRPGEIVAGGSTTAYPALEAWTGTVVAGRGRRQTVHGRLKTVRRSPA